MKSYVIPWPGVWFLSWKCISVRIRLNAKLFNEALGCQSNKNKKRNWEISRRGHLERLPGQCPPRVWGLGIWSGCLGSAHPGCAVCVSSPVGPSRDPARTSTCSHPSLWFLVSCALLSVFPAPTLGLPGPIKHQQHVFSPSLRPLDPGSLSFLPVLHCSSFLSTISSLNSLLVLVYFVPHPLSNGSMYPAPCTPGEMTQWGTLCHHR